MKMRPFLSGALLGAVILSAGVGTPVAAWAAPTPLAAAMSLAYQKNYDAALLILRQAEAKNPEDPQLRIAEARVLSWKGNYAAAASRLESLPPAFATDADVQLLWASLAYYQSDYERAAALYRKILAAHPNYGDARTGLARVSKAQADRAARLAGRWTITGEAGRSSFAKASQAPWSHQALTIARKLSGTETSLEVSIVHANRYGTLSDTQYMFGLSRRLFQEWSARARVGYSPQANFFAHQSIELGLTRQLGKGPVSIAIDARRDIYSSTSVSSVDLSLTAGLSKGWTLTPMLTATHTDHGSTVYGGGMRLYGSLNSRLTLQGGISNTPDTELGITRRMRSWFLGARYRLSDHTAISLFYTQEDLRNIYRRKEVSLAVSIRF